MRSRSLRQLQRILLLVIPLAAFTGGSWERASLGSSEQGSVAKKMVRRKAVRGRRGQTYISEVLERRDSVVSRWSAEKAVVGIWIAPGSDFAGWRPEFVASVNSAVKSWDRVGLPVRLRIVTDSSDADVTVMWTEPFVGPFKESSGVTFWSGRGALKHAAIQLAVRRPDESPLSPAAVQSLALHEIGHALGLDHTGDVSSVMAPRVQVPSLSAKDIATAETLYALPQGSLR